jgi:hypothetical protein
MIATPLNSLTRRMGVAVGASDAMPYSAPEVVAYGVRYAASLGVKHLLEDDGAKLVEWIDL